VVRACLVSSYPPMQCGIATFSRDLRSGLMANERPVSVSALAVGELPPGQRFPREVVLRIDKEGREGYRKAGRALDLAGYDVVNVQHEFGIFGGPEGRDIVALLDEVSRPTVTTLHTVVQEPEPHYRRALLAVADASDRLVAPTRSARRILTEVYGIEERRISVIHHGVPDVPFTDPDKAKAELGFAGRQVLLTFGLLSRNKGIEVLLDALPEIVAEHPDVLYVVLGATHPTVRRDEGETYRGSLQRMVAERGLERHVAFHDHYVDQDELVTYLTACDLYVTPYLSREQIVSGTLAYAVGMGKAVVSTPYRYAQELLAEDRGRLVEFGDSEGMAATLSELLGDDAEREGLRRRAYAYGREMTWPEVGRRYLELFDEVRATGPTVTGWEGAVPSINLAHLQRLTDDTGTLQHALWEVPDRRFGYTTDDVARALIVAVRAHARHGHEEALRVATTSLAFMAHAQRDDGRFRNEMGYDRRWLDDLGSEDTFGQSLWGLGVAFSEARTGVLCSLAGDLFTCALPGAAALRWPRAIAYAICGICAYLRARPGEHEAQAALTATTGRLVELYEASRTDDWHWFGDDVTYANAKLPHALLLAARTTGDDRLLHIGLESLDFLLGLTYSDGRFDFVGNEGWYHRGRPRAIFGQQPIEAGYTVEVCLLAASLTDDARYHELARAALDWFTGRNRLGVALYDPETGACFDGLDAHGANTNAGAESCLCCLLGLLAAEEAGLMDR
jgi:glycosyltransferase involved in cell wall biosynthesis